MTTITISFEWKPLGPITLDGDGRLRFPSAPNEPGIYRFDVGSGCYVGEASILRRRFAHYRNPGPSQQTNLRLNPLLVEAASNNEAFVSLMVGASAVSSDDTRVQLDLGVKSSRVMLENAAIVLALASGETLLNH